MLKWYCECRLTESAYLPVVNTSFIEEDILAWRPMKALFFSGFDILLFGFIFCTILTYGLKRFRPCSLNLYGSSLSISGVFDNPAWLWTISRQYMIILNTCKRCALSFGILPLAAYGVGSRQNLTIK